MILFDLKCSEDHTFEGWFPDSNTFERQRRKGEFLCPVCGTREVEKALMAPNVTTSKTKEAGRAQQTQAATMAMLAKMREHVETNCDYVGPEFAEEARKIHYGDVKKRDIYGEATDDDAAELEEEGIEFGRIPWLTRAEH